MRFLPFVLIILAIDLYAFQGVRLVGQTAEPWLRNLLYFIFWSIPVGTLCYVVIATNAGIAASKNPLLKVIRAVIFLAYLTKVLMAVPLLVDDIFRGGFWIMDNFGLTNGWYREERSLLAAQLGLLLGGLPFILLVYGMIRNPYRYRVFREIVSIKNLPTSLAGLRIVQISDIHAGSFTRKEPVRRGIDLINQQKPDLVFFTGDLVNDVAGEMDNYLDVFDQIKARYGVFSVLGNHDYGEYVRWASKEARDDNMNRLFEVHKKLGWQLLMNEHKILTIENEAVAIIGVENYAAKGRFPKYGNLEKAHQGTGEARLKLLLSHDPSHWDYQVTSDFPEIDITFSGHTHGMQFGIEIPGVFKWSPIKYVYKEWAGLYRKGDQYLYVNRGFGFLGYPGRVGILPEITVLELAVD